MDLGRHFPSDFRLILASQSPRRHSLLRDVGVPFTVVSSQAVEALAGADAATLAQLNAKAKVQGAVLPAGLPAGAFVLGTDTLVTSDGAVMGKPSSAEEAAQMLRSLSGRVHQVVSGVALVRTAGETGTQAAVPAGVIHVAVATTDVTFRHLGAAEAEAYVDSGEWRGKAGGYAIQGLAAFFVSEVRGEYSNVVGLPLGLLGEMFREQGFDLVQRTWLCGWPEEGLR
jgi:septum formation protein